MNWIKIILNFKNEYEDAMWLKFSEKPVDEVLVEKATELGEFELAKYTENYF